MTGWEPTLDRLISLVTIGATFLLAAAVLRTGYRHNSRRGQISDFPSRPLIAAIFGILTIGTVTALGMPQLLSTEVVSAVFGAAITGAVTMVGPRRHGDDSPPMNRESRQGGDQNNLEPARGEAVDRASPPPRTPTDDSNN